MTGSSWIDNSGGGNVQYDFHPPADWTGQRIAAEQAAIATLLEAADGDDNATAAPGWLRLAARLPAALRNALAAELRAGNRLAGISSTGWPGEGSIVVNVRERFTTARQAPGVAWRRLDDPHYAREELSERMGPVEHLVLA